MVCNSTQDKDHDDDYQEFFPHNFGQNFLIIIRGPKKKEGKIDPALRFIRLRHLFQHNDDLV